MRSMRVCDILASNWNFVWGMNIVIVKSLQLLGYFNIAGSLFPSLLLLLFFSAYFTLLLIFVALVIDIYRCKTLSNTSNVHLETCKGHGICWHAYPNCYILYDH